MIKRNVITPGLVQIVGPDGQRFDNVNDLELLDIQCQIAEQKLTGYAVHWNDKVIPINEKGELAEWPAGMLDMQMKLHARLFKARRHN